jgi:hypothetical protein
VGERGSGRSDETLKKFYIIECDFGISGCRLDDFERNVSTGSVRVREIDR